MATSSDGLMDSKQQHPLLPWQLFSLWLLCWAFVLPVATIASWPIAPWEWLCWHYRAGLRFPKHRWTAHLHVLPDDNRLVFTWPAAGLHYRTEWQKTSARHQIDENILLIRKQRLPLAAWTSKTLRDKRALIESDPINEKMNPNCTHSEFDQGHQQHPLSISLKLYPLFSFMSSFSVLYFFE